jgi:hypothetical protein
MLTIPEPEPRPQPTDRPSRIDSKKPLETCNSITRFWGGGFVETNPTMHRSNGFKIPEDGKSIVSLAALGARPATSIEQLRWDSRSRQDFTPPATCRLLKLSNRMIVMISMGVVGHAAPPFLLSSSLARYFLSPPILYDGISPLAVQRSIEGTLAPRIFAASCLSMNPSSIGLPAKRATTISATRSAT